MTDVIGHEECRKFARSVCFYCIGLVIMLGVISVIATQERAEARLAQVRADNLRAFTSSRSLAELEARLAAAENSALPIRRDGETPTKPRTVPGADARQKEMLMREHRDVAVLSAQYDQEAEQERSHADMATMAQVIMMVALLVAPLSGPTNKLVYCRLALAIATAGVALASYTYIV